jgi:hypothetical protein
LRFVLIRMSAETARTRFVRTADTRTLARVTNGLRLSPDLPFQLWPRSGSFVWWGRLRVTHWQRKFGMPPGFAKHEADATPTLRKRLLAEHALREVSLCCAEIPPELVDLLHCWLVLLGS